MRPEAWTIGRCWRGRAARRGENGTEVARRQQGRREKGIPIYGLGTHHSVSKRFCNEDVLEVVTFTHPRTPHQRKGKSTFIKTLSRKGSGFCGD